MRITALLAVLVFAFPVRAIAQTPACQSIQNAADRLACYDKAKPPVATPKQAAKTKSGTKPPPDQSQLVDQLAAENARLDAKLKTICRGC